MVVTDKEETREETQEQMLIYNLGKEINHISCEELCK